MKLKLRLEDPALSADDRIQVEACLQKHNFDQVEQRRLQKQYIVQYAIAHGANEQTAEADIGASRLTDYYDDDEDSNDKVEDIFHKSNVVLMCEDYGGNIPIPTFNSRRPGSDYYLSHLNLNFLFIAI